MTAGPVRLAPRGTALAAGSAKSDAAGKSGESGGLGTGGGSGGSTGRGATVGGQLSRGYFGPFLERKGCPPGSVVAHRFGRGRDRMVQCKTVSVAAPPPVPVSRPQQQSQVFKPTITVNPNIQTQVSPQISPVFQQTGSGDQDAGTAMTSPGGQSGSSAPANSGVLQMLSFLDEREKRQERIAEEKRQRDEQVRLEQRRQEEYARTLAAPINSSPVQALPPAAAPVTAPGPSYGGGGGGNYVSPLSPGPVEASIGPLPQPEEGSRYLLPGLIGAAILTVGGVYFMTKKQRQK